MKKTIRNLIVALAGAAVLALALVGCSGSAQQEGTVVDFDHGKIVFTDSQAVIYLKDNEATGYLWYVTGAPAELELAESADCTIAKETVDAPGCRIVTLTLPAGHSESCTQTLEMVQMSKYTQTNWGTIVEATDVFTITVEGGKITGVSATCDGFPRLK